LRNCGIAAERAEILLQPSENNGTAGWTDRLELLPACLPAAAAAGAAAGAAADHNAGEGCKLLHIDGWQVSLLPNHDSRLLGQFEPNMSGPN